MTGFITEREMSGPDFDFDREPITDAVPPPCQLRDLSTNMLFETGAITDAFALDLCSSEVSSLASIIYYIELMDFFTPVAKERIERTKQR